MDDERRPTLRPPALLFGVPVGDVTMDETVELFETLIGQGRARRRTHQIATVNVDFLVNALDDPEIASILQAAELCIPDGMPVVWGARALGMPLRERVAGADLVPRLIDESQATGWRIHVLGSLPDVAERAEELIAGRYPGANTSIDPDAMVTADGAVGDDVLESIAAIDPDILCVALGNPKQERFIQTNRDRLGTPVMIGVGGSLDMMVGERKRAPVWVQRIGMEWIARALQEPRRLGTRYAHDIRTFSPRFAREFRANRGRRDQPGFAIHVEAGRVEARLGTSYHPDADEWARATVLVADRATLRIDPASTTSINDASAAQLVGLVQVARWFDAPVEWIESPDQLRSGFLELGIRPRMLACTEEWQPCRHA